MAYLPNALMAPSDPTKSSQSWPRRHDVIGVPVSVTNYAEAVDCLINAAHEKRSALATAFAVHGVVEAARNNEFRRKISTFELITPDGQPVRHALNVIFGTKLSDRVYGPTLMILLCRRAAAEGISIYLYGSTESTVQRLQRALKQKIPNLHIAGAEPSLFRPLHREESIALTQRIERSGASIVFVGLGCPRQEDFAYEHRDLIPAVLICVGAAFDFHSGTKPQAPQWMQDYALEWLFRLVHEPRRLFKRYAVTNFVFVTRILWQLAHSRMSHFHR